MRDAQERRADFWAFRPAAWRSGGRFLRLIFVRGAALPLSLAANLALGRLLGPASFGVYSCYLSVALVAAAFLVLGADKVMLRELARLEAPARGPALRALLGWAARSHLPIFIVLALLFAGGVGVVAARGGAPALVLAASLIAPCYALTILAAGILSGFERVGVAQSLDNIIKNVVLLAGVAVAWRLQMRGIFGFLVLQAASFAAAMVCGWVYLFAVVRPAWRAADAGISPPRAKNFQAASHAFFIGGSAVALMGRFDVILVSLFGTDYQTGLFGAANRFAQAGSLIALAVMYKSQPVFSRAATMTPLQVRARLQRGRVVSFGLTLLCLGPAFVWAGVLLGVMGRPFMAAAPSFRILLIGYLASSAVAPDYAYLAMNGQERALALIAWAQLAAIILLTACLAPDYGARGGAAAYSCASAGGAMAVFLRSRQRLGLAAEAGACA